MKLSEILKDWPKKKEFSMSDVFKEIDSLKDGFNTALDACDHEIDREALEEILMNPSNSKENNINFGVVNDYKARYLANAIIATMPTWLRKVSEKIGGDGPRLYAEAICQTFGTPKVEWPERRTRHHKLTQKSEGYNQGWNDCLDACRRAYEEAGWKK